MAELVRQLFEHYNIRVLGFDVDFQDADATAGGQLLDNLAKGPLADLPGFAERLPALKDKLDGDASSPPCSAPNRWCWACS